MENFKLAFDLTDKSKIQVQLNKYGAVCFWQEFKKHGYLSQWFSGVISNGFNEKPQFTGSDLFDNSDKTKHRCLKMLKSNKKSSKNAIRKILKNLDGK